MMKKLTQNYVSLITIYYVDDENCYEYSNKTSIMCYK